MGPFSRSTQAKSLLIFTSIVYIFRLGLCFIHGGKWDVFADYSTASKRPKYNWEFHCWVTEIQGSCDFYWIMSLCMWQNCVLSNLTDENCGLNWQLYLSNKKALIICSATFCVMLSSEKDWCFLNLQSTSILLAMAMKNFLMAIAPTVKPQCMYVGQTFHFILPLLTQQWWVPGGRKLCQWLEQCVLPGEMRLL